jgi:DNA-directed RNA polymerase subunit RPC12/RpoP
VPSETDLLFGKLALRQAYCTKEQIDRCLAIQSTRKDGTPLGRVLVAEGYLTEGQHSEILSLQRKHASTEAADATKLRESALFGKLAAREGLLTDAEVDECLREQAAEGGKKSLGEVMIGKGYLTGEQVKSLLAKQQKRIMNCRTCRLSFTVLTISQGKTIGCPRCKRPLEDGKPSDSTRTDAEFATQVFRAVKKEIPSGSSPGTRIGSTGAAKSILHCVVCTHRFEGAPDPTGRVRCPSCQSTFLAKTL